jgi:type IV pilus assembly protein PilO
MNQLKAFFEQLRGLDPNDPGRWPLIVRIGTVAIVFLVVALGGYYWFVWKQDRPKLLEARAKEGELMQTLETKARRAANLGAYRAQLAEMQQSFGAMLRQLPNKTEVPNLLVDISQTGLAAGLEEKLFQPQGENKKDFYAELPITIRLTGGYHEMGRFASGIAALPRIVTLHDIEITPPGRDRNAAIDAGQLNLSVTAKTYRYLDEEEQAPAPGAKAKKAAKKNNKKKAAGA